MISCLSWCILCLSVVSGQRQFKALSFSNSTVHFTFDLLKELSKTPGNIVFSPTSIGVLLSILQQGSHGITKDELNRIMHAVPPETLRGYQSLLQPEEPFQYKLARKDEPTVIHQMANKLFINPRNPVNSNFQNRIERSYNTKIAMLHEWDPSQSASEINQWVQAATNGHITDIVNAQSLGLDTALVMVSAMYFKGKWQKKFTEIRPEKFRLSPTSDIITPFLVTQQTLTAGRENSFKWIELPYKGGAYSMYLVRPTAAHRHDLHGMIEKMNGTTLRHIFTAKTKRNVSLRLPKFKIQQKPAIKTALQQMGLESIFSANADLRQMNDNLRVSDISHEAYVDVNEDGTEAAAATAVVVHTLSASWNPNDLDFRLDEPFLAFVVDKKRSIPILAVKIVDPSS